MTELTKQEGKVRESFQSQSKRGGGKGKRKTNQKEKESERKLSKVQ